MTFNMFFFVKNFKRVSLSTWSNNYQLKRAQMTRICTLKMFLSEFLWMSVVWDFVKSMKRSLWQSSKNSIQREYFAKRAKSPSDRNILQKNPCDENILQKEQKSPSDGNILQKLYSAKRRWCQKNPSDRNILQKRSFLCGEEVMPKRNQFPSCKVLQKF